LKINPSQNKNLWNLKNQSSLYHLIQVKLPKSKPFKSFWSQKRMKLGDCRNKSINKIRN
jgi:hypothetical protein